MYCNGDIFIIVEKAIQNGCGYDFRSRIDRTTCPEIERVILVVFSDTYYRAELKGICHRNFRLADKAR